MSVRYGVLRGKPAKILHHKPDDPAPHLEVLIETPDGRARFAVNVRSDEGTNLLFHAEPDFKHPLVADLATLPQGLTRPARDDRRLRLDYVRGGFFDFGLYRGLRTRAPSAIRMRSIRS